MYSSARRGNSLGLVTTGIGEFANNSHISAESETHDQNPDVVVAFYRGFDSVERCRLLTIEHSRHYTGFGFIQRRAGIGHGTVEAIGPLLFD
jgi:hypothetical protein